MSASADYGRDYEKSLLDGVECENVDGVRGWLSSGSVKVWSELRLAFRWKHCSVEGCFWLSGWERGSVEGSCRLADQPCPALARWKERLTHLGPILLRHALLRQEFIETFHVRREKSTGRSP